MKWICSAFMCTKFVCDQTRGILVSDALCVRASSSEPAFDSGKGEELRHSLGGTRNEKVVHMQLVQVSYQHNMTCSRLLQVIP